MPDPVSCHPAHNDPSIIECDPIFIGPEPARAPAAENQSTQPGVRALVSSHEPPLRVRSTTTVEVPRVVDPAELAVECGGKALGLVLGMFGAVKLHPALGILTGAKLGYDVGQCIGETVIDATQRAAEASFADECSDAGGTPLGRINGALVCELSPEEE
jgi:hypothetical protein